MVEMLEPEFDPQDRNKVQRKAMVTVMANEIGKQQAFLRAILYLRRVKVIRLVFAGLLVAVLMMML